MRRPTPVPRSGPGASDIGELCAIVEERTGVTVSEAKRGVVAVRLAARLRELRVPSIDAYCRLVERGDAELHHVIDLITTRETSFFRHAHHFSFLEQHLVPAWQSEASRGRRAHEVRVWSAGCSTGEEPYSIAMSLRAGLPLSAGWNVQVLATDISDAALDAARAGVFPAERAWHIPEDYRRLFTREQQIGGRAVVRIEPEVARTVRFERVNLLDEIYPAPRDFDLVFCRNVLIYFRPAERQAIVDRLVDHLAPAGHLILGQAEGLMGASRLRRVAPTVYRHAPLSASIPPSRPARRAYPRERR
jgi:chemotaxis protein methyltransferase CheR